jgi:hypothetical protein
MGQPFFSIVIPTLVMIPVSDRAADHPAKAMHRYPPLGQSV